MKKTYLDYEKCKKITEDGYTPVDKPADIMEGDGNVSAADYLYADDEVWAVTQEDWDEFYSADEPIEETPLEIAERTAKENYNKYLLALADSENIKKRLNAKISDINKYKYEGIMKDLLEVVDNFERSLAAFVIKDETNEANYNGIKIIYEQLNNVLKNNGLTPIEVNIKDKFNVDMMNAIVTVTLPGYKENEVVEVSKKGYVYNDKIIRYADVVVNTLGNTYEGTN